MAGVGYAIKSKTLPSPPKGITDRLMVVRLPLLRKRHASADDMKTLFYEDLKDTNSSAPRSDKLVILSDFNVRVRRDHSSWEAVRGGMV